MRIRILFDNGKKTRWLGIGEKYTIENLKDLILMFKETLNCQGVNYQLEYKN